MTYCVLYNTVKAKKANKNIEQRVLPIHNHLPLLIMVPRSWCPSMECADLFTRVVK